MWILTSGGKDDHQLINLDNSKSILMKSVEGGEHAPDQTELHAVANDGSTVVIGEGHIDLIGNAIMDIFDSLETGERTWSFHEFAARQKT